MVFVAQRVLAWMSSKALRLHNSWVRIWCVLLDPALKIKMSHPNTSVPHRRPHCPCMPVPFVSELSFHSMDSLGLVNAPLPMSLPLCVKRMQFLSLPQWCSAWSAPESTWCGVTGVATLQKAWTLTTQSTAKPPARARRTKSTSGGLTPWDTTSTTTHSRKELAWAS